MTRFSSVVKKTLNGIVYVDIPHEILKEINLKPFMAGRMKAEKNKIILFDFQKTVKIKIKLDEKTIEIAKKIMKLEGYGSLDETLSNVIHHFFRKETDKTHIIYIYPEKYFQSNCILINDFEKKFKNKRKWKNAKKPS